MFNGGSRAKRPLQPITGQKRLCPTLILDSLKGLFGVFRSKKNPKSLSSTVQYDSSLLFISVSFFFVDNLFRFLTVSSSSPISFLFLFLLFLFFLLLDFFVLGRMKRTKNLVVEEVTMKN